MRIATLAYFSFIRGERCYLVSEFRGCSGAPSGSSPTRWNIDRLRFAVF